VRGTWGIYAGFTSHAQIYAMGIAYTCTPNLMGHSNHISYLCGHQLEGKSITLTSCLCFLPVIWNSTKVLDVRVVKNLTYVDEPIIHNKKASVKDAWDSVIIGTNSLVGSYLGSYHVYRTVVYLLLLALLEIYHQHHNYLLDQSQKTLQRRLIQ